MIALAAMKRSTTTTKQYEPRLEPREMTPLAFRIAKQATLPKRERSFVDGELLQRICAARCFETSAVQELVVELVNSFNRKPEPNEEVEYLTVDGERTPLMSKQGAANVVAMAGQMAFLPAPYTWIEWKAEPLGGQRLGWFLCEDFYEQDDIRDWITAFSCNEDGSTFCMSFPKQGDPTNLKLHGDGYGEATDAERFTCGVFLPVILGNLALINTPHVISQTVDPPHRGLQKRLGRVLSLPGKYPLQDWHEVKLHVAVAPEFSGRAGEAHLSGERALHFCRSYLRVRLGRVELVRPHWRGNPAIGIKQTDYRVVE
jgi:hypothetical protein